MRKAAFERSRIRPETYGPRSWIVTITYRSPERTETLVPHGRVRLAA